MGHIMWVKSSEEHHFPRYETANIAVPLLVSGIPLGAGAHGDRVSGHAIGVSDKEQRTYPPFRGTSGGRQARDRIGGAVHWFLKQGV